jgi:DNA-binding response OmpR family regulator
MAPEGAVAHGLGWRHREGTRVDRMVRGLNAGADAYIVKREFRQSELLEVVDRLLGRATLRDLAVSM